MQVLKYSLYINFHEVPKETTFHHGLKVVKSFTYVNLIWFIQPSFIHVKNKNKKTTILIYKDFWWLYWNQIPNDSSMCIRSITSFHSLLHSTVILALLEDVLCKFMWLLRWSSAKFSVWIRRVKFSLSQKNLQVNFQSWSISTVLCLVLVNINCLFNTVFPLINLVTLGHHLMVQYHSTLFLRCILLRYEFRNDYFMHGHLSPYPTTVHP